MEDQQESARTTQLEMVLQNLLEQFEETPSGTIVETTDGIASVNEATEMAIVAARAVLYQESEC